jgi:hypothetical protein
VRIRLLRYAILDAWRDGLAGIEGTAMSYITAASTGTSKVSRLLANVRRSWTEARHLDRRLMEIRTNLSRHSG